MEKFAIGLALGALGGALLTANNYKMRTLVKKTQQEAQNKLDKMIDEKLDCFTPENDENEPKTQENTQKTAKKAKRKANKD